MVMFGYTVSRENKQIQTKYLKTIDLICHVGGIQMVKLDCVEIKKDFCSYDVRKLSCAVVRRGCNRL